MPHHRPTLVLVAFLVVCAGPSAPVQGQDFRIDSTIYVGQQREPVNRSTTIFQGDDAFDYLDKPAEVFCVLGSRQRVALLDVDRRVCAEIPTRRVLAFSDEIRSRAESQQDPFLQFMAAPTFEQQFDATTSTLTLNSPWLSYRVVGAPARQLGFAHSYREFSDWYVRANPMVNAAARPPFPRLSVNEALERLDLLPKEVELTITPKRGIMSRRLTIRSEHQIADQLSESDRKRVEQTRQFLAIFSPVSVEQYRKMMEQGGAGQ